MAHPISAQWTNKNIIDCRTQKWRTQRRTVAQISILSICRLDNPARFILGRFGRSCSVRSFLQRVATRQSNITHQLFSHVIAQPIFVSSNRSSRRQPSQTKWPQQRCGVVPSDSQCFCSHLCDASHVWDAGYHVWDHGLLGNIWDTGCFCCHHYQAIDSRTQNGL